MFTDGNKTIVPVPIILPLCIGTSLFLLMGDQTVHEDSNNVTRFKYAFIKFLAKYIYKINTCTD